MSSTVEMRDAVRVAQQCNINLYRYLINGLVDNSLMLSQLKVEFEDYTRSSMRFLNQLTQIRDSKIPIVRQQEEQINVLLEQVKRNDQLRQQIHVIRVRGEMGQQIPMVDPNMIVQDFPELCVSRSPSDIPITVLCELIIRKYNVHNDSFIKTMLKRIEEESVSTDVSNPEQVVTSITPTMVDMQPVVPPADIHAVTPDLSFPLTTCATDDMFDVTTSTQSTDDMFDVTASTQSTDDMFDVTASTQSTDDMFDVTASTQSTDDMFDVTTSTQSTDDMFDVTASTQSTDDMFDVTASTQSTDDMFDVTTSTQSTDDMFDVTASTQSTDDMFDVTTSTQSTDDMFDVTASTQSTDDMFDVTASTQSIDDMFDVTTSTQSTEVPNNEDDVLDDLLSVLADIPELDTEYHPSVNKKSPCAVRGPVSTTSKLSTTPSRCNSSLLARPTKKREVKRDYKEYPEYTPRTSPALSWDQLIERFQKLDNSHGTTKQDQTTVTAKQEATCVPTKQGPTEVPPVVNTKVTQETANIDLHDSQLKPSALPNGTHTPMVATKSLQSNDVSEILSVFESKKRRQQASNSLTPAELVKRKQEVAVLQLIKLNTQKDLNEQEPTPMVSTKTLQSDVVSEIPSTKTLQSDVASEIPPVIKERKQHAPKDPSNNLTTAESLKRKEQLAALELKKQKTQKVLNDQFTKSWEGKAFLHKMQNASKVEKVTETTAQTVSSKYQPTARAVGQSSFSLGNQSASRAINQSAARNVIQSGVGVINQSTFRVGYQAACRNLNQSTAKVVTQPAAKVVNKPAVSHPSRKRPSSSSVDTAVAKRRRANCQPRIILKIFREDSEWNVEQIVDRYY